MLARFARFAGILIFALALNGCGGGRTISSSGSSGGSGATVSTTTTVVTANHYSVYGSNTNVTLSASVTTSGDLYPTGTVTFWDGSTVLGSGSLREVSTTISATDIVTPLSPGTNSISAVYFGDAYNAGSTSRVVNVTVSP